MPPFSPILVRSIWRGVRSGVLVLTETQVQNYSQSGKIGSKHPNVIFIYSLQCDFMQKNPKKHLKKNADFSMRIRLLSSAMTENTPKNRSLNRELLNIVYRYGIFYTVPSESLCPDGSEYVWQRVVGGVKGRDTDGRSWPSFPTKLKPNCGVTKLKTL